jgi:hypothetical protein
LIISFFTGTPGRGSPERYASDEGINRESVITPTKTMIEDLLKRLDDH